MAQGVDVGRASHLSRPVLGGCACFPPGNFEGRSHPRGAVRRTEYSCGRNESTATEKGQKREHGARVLVSVGPSACGRPVLLSHDGPWAWGSCRLLPPCVRPRRLTVGTPYGLLSRTPGQRRLHGSSVLSVSLAAEVHTSFPLLPPSNCQPTRVVSGKPFLVVRDYFIYRRLSVVVLSHRPIVAFLVMELGGVVQSHGLIKPRNSPICGASVYISSLAPCKVGDDDMFEPSTPVRSNPYGQTRPPFHPGANNI